MRSNLDPKNYINIKKNLKITLDFTQDCGMYLRSPKK